MTSERNRIGRGFWVWWVLLILVGVVMNFVLAGGLASEQAGFWGGVAVVGAIQWIVMRRQASRSEWQVLASMGGYAMGYATGHAVLHAIIEGEGPSVFAVGWGALAVVSAVITGIALLSLLRPRVPESPGQ